MTSPAPSTPPAPHASDPYELIRPLLHWGDRLAYIAIATLFLFAAIAMGGYSIFAFFTSAAVNFPLRIMGFVNDLLLVLIILEVLGTVRSYLETQTTSLKPFLYIGAISATRRILAIGAETTLGESLTQESFNRLMLDLSINGAVVLAIAVALFLFNRHIAAAEPAGPASPQWD